MQRSDNRAESAEDAEWKDVSVFSVIIVRKLLIPLCSKNYLAESAEDVERKDVSVFSVIIVRKLLVPLCSKNYLAESAEDAERKDVSVCSVISVRSSVLFNYNLAKVQSRKKIKNKFRVFCDFSEKLFVGLFKRNPRNIFIARIKNEKNFFI